MAAVIAEICEWAKELPYWEQIALDRILAGLTLSEEDFNELLAYLLEDEQLVERKSTRPQLRFITSKGKGEWPTRGRVRLLSMSKLRNVNMLAENQNLTFGPALTVIYGANCSGKSGYARVLGVAGLTRGDCEILPDVITSGAESAPQVAQIEIEDDFGSRSLSYDLCNPSSELSSVYVFDSTSVWAHLMKANRFSFSPAGLSYLTRLAEGTDNVRKRLTELVEAKRVGHQFNLLFDGSSEISILISELGSDTDVDDLNRLASLTEEEREKIGELDLEIARLKTEDVSGEIGRIDEAMSDLGRLKEDIGKTERALSDEAIGTIKDAIELYNSRLTAVQSVGVAQFSTERLTQVGTDVWRNFIESAKALADAERIGVGGVSSYPSEEDYCLLCQQRLSEEARDLLLRLWAFLEEATQTELEIGERRLESEESKLRAINLDFFHAQSVAYRHLERENSEVASKITEFMTGCRQRRDRVLELIETRMWESPPSLPGSCVVDVERIVENLGSRRGELEERKRDGDVSQLEKQLRYLRHREVLSKHLGDIIGYVEGRKWAERAAVVGGTTHHITLKYNELFDRMVTDRYIELFSKTLERLKRPLRVKVRMSGKKGEAVKQIVLETPSGKIVESATPGKVLSEGEKRAVALADFLTEVAVDRSSCGIILDDPVTSLDLEWRNTIAEILAGEARNRQVIVFTHDLPFVYYLKENAEKEGVEIAAHWIRRGSDDDKPGYVFLNNSPVLERDYRKATRARETYARAKYAEPAEQEFLLREGFGSLRSSYEALIIFNLLNEVVMRFSDRISVGRLREIVWDKEIVEEVMQKYELLSRYIEAHLRSDALAGTKPGPHLLMDEIEAFERLNGRLNKLKELKRKE